MFVLFVLMSVGVCFSNENYTGYGGTEFIDTIDDFRTDSLKYSKAFNLSKYENLRVDVLADDTSSAGFESDSVHFRWGIQTGHPIKNASGLLDTSWNPVLIVLDTLNSVAGTWGPQYAPMGVDGTTNNSFGVIDSLSVTGLMMQSKSPVVDWDVLFRGWAQSMTSNKKSKFIFLKFNVVQRLYTNVE